MRGYSSGTTVRCSAQARSIAARSTKARRKTARDSARDTAPSRWYDRTSGDTTAHHARSSGCSAAGRVPLSAYTGSTRNSPRTRSGCSKASVSASIAPIECAASSTGVRRASQVACKASRASCA